jgi:hypothetical protein
VARFRKVYQPELLSRTLDRLPKGCEWITRCLGCDEQWHEDIKKVLGARSTTAAASTWTCGFTETVRRQGYPPSMREIGQAVKLASTSSVAHQLMALGRKGILYRDPHRPRAYRVRPSWTPETGEGPERGTSRRVARGPDRRWAPLLAQEMVEDVYSLPRQFCVNSQRVAAMTAGDRNRAYGRSVASTSASSRRSCSL